VTARPLERRVDGRQVHRARQVQRGLQQVQQRGAGEHEPVDGVGVLEDPLLRRERAHRVSEQHHRHPGHGRAAQLQQHPDVVDQCGPAAGQHALGHRRGTVAAVVLRLDGETVLHQRRRQRRVAAGVLAHAVGELHEAAGRPGR
jgi:hypothetical protein